jgi:ribonuclease BN (tRNA processing enzyme)
MDVVKGNGRLELTVLGCSGSYGAPAGGACSSYLVRAGATTIWLDCGNGSFANLQQHARVEDIDAVVITHGHPDHCVDIYGLHVLYKYGLERDCLPVFAPDGVDKQLEALVGEWDDTFDWHLIGDGDDATVGEAHLAFSRTDHPPPTMAVEIAHGERRLVYTSDTGPGWSPPFAPGADLFLSEATYQHDDIRAPIHLSARQAGELARAAQAKELMLTHLWPSLDPVASVEEAAEAFGRTVVLAAPHLVTHV